MGTDQRRNQRQDDRNPQSEQSSLHAVLLHRLFAVRLLLRSGNNRHNLHESGRSCLSGAVFS